MRQEMDVKVYVSTRNQDPGRVRSVDEHIARVMDDIGNAVDPMLRERPVACVDAVTNGRENRGIVASPQFWSENDMAELGAVRDLTNIR